MMLLLIIIFLVQAIPLASIYLSTILIHRFTFLIILLSTSLFIEMNLLGELFQTIQLSQIPFMGDSLEESNILFCTFIPIMLYPNADTDKLSILTDNKGKAGIYLWTHKESGKVYIGSSANLSVRFRFYYSISYLTRYKNSYINSALLFHGYSAFSLTILEYINIKDLSKEEAKKLILEREQYYLDLTSETENYNILKLAGSSLGFKLSEKTKALMRKPKMNLANYGQVHSAETKAKMSLSRKGITKTEKTRALMSLAKNKKVYVYTMDTVLNERILFKSFNSCAETMKYLNCSKMTITRYIDSNKLYKNKYILSSNEHS